MNQLAANRKREGRETIKYQHKFSENHSSPRRFTYTSVTLSEHIFAKQTQKYCLLHDRHCSNCSIRNTSPNHYNKTSRVQGSKITCPRPHNLLLAEPRAQPRQFSC